MCRIHIAALLLAIPGLSVQGADGEGGLSDTEIWNEGVGYFRSGDYTNAVRVLRPLMLTREYGPRAAEVVAKVAWDKAHTPGEENALAALEEAAAAAQIALRASPGDPRAERNFTRSTEGLAELRETKRINKVLEAARGRDPASIIGEAMRSAREIMSGAQKLPSLPAAEAVAEADRLSSRAEGLCDSWIQAKEAICSSVTNEEQAASIATHVDQARSRTAGAAKALGDMDEGAYGAIAESEQDFALFHKMTVMPREALQEDLVAQSNAWMDVEAFNGRQWQEESLAYTRAFRARFPAWADAYAQRAAADTNLPPFTAEARGRIESLAADLEKMQESCVARPVPTVQEEGVGVIREMIELMPRENGGKSGGESGDGGGQSGAQPQASPPGNEEGGGGDDGSGENAEDDSGGDARDGAEDAQADEPSADRDDREVESLLRRAQERSDEHEAEKRARMRKAPLPPNARDW